MKCSWSIRNILFLLVLLMTATASSAATREIATRLQFVEGATSTVITDSVHAGKRLIYVLKVDKEKQDLGVNIDSARKNAYFEMYEQPSKKQIDPSKPEKWTKKAGVSLKQVLEHCWAGEYLIVVESAAGKADFQLEVTLSDHLQPLRKIYSMVLDFSADGSICRDMTVTDEEVKPPASSDKTLLSDPADDYVSWEEAPSEGEFTRGTFDADNDGIPDTVFQLRTYTRYMSADYFFIAKGSYVAQLWPYINEERLLKHSKYIYPCSWVAETGQNRACEPFHDRDDRNRISDMPIKGYRGKMKAPWYHFRYTYFDPFRYKGTTYFLATSPQYYDREEIFTVYRPKPGGKADEVCVFRRMELNPYTDEVK